jgi:hypothetical protein
MSHRRGDVENVSLPDVTVPLGDGQVAAECIRPDGGRTFWILVPGGDAGQGCACRRCAPHEQTGRLSAAVKIALGRTCAHVHPRTGLRCRQPVPEFGLRCTHHAAADERARGDAQ